MIFTEEMQVEDILTDPKFNKAKRLSL